MLGFIKGGNFIIYLKDDYLLRKGPWSMELVKSNFLPWRWRQHILLYSCFPCSKICAVSPRIPPHMTEKFSSLLRHGKLQNMYRPLDGSSVVAVKESSTRWKSRVSRTEETTNVYRLLAWKTE
jgi:hypothetical protein